MAIILELHCYVSKDYFAFQTLFSQRSILHQYNEILLENQCPIMVLALHETPTLCEWWGSRGSLTDYPWIQLSCSMSRLLCSIYEKKNKLSLFNVVSFFFRWVKRCLKYPQITLTVSWVTVSRNALCG